MSVKSTGMFAHAVSRAMNRLSRLFDCMTSHLTSGHLLMVL